jgi:hypothetical protein
MANVSNLINRNEIKVFRFDLAETESVISFLFWKRYPGASTIFVTRINSVLEAGIRD